MAGIFQTTLSIYSKIEAALTNKQDIKALGD